MDYWKTSEASSTSPNTNTMNPYNSNQRGPSFQLPTPTSSGQGPSAIDRLLASSPHTAFREGDGYFSRQQGGGGGGAGDGKDRGYAKREVDRYGNNGTGTPASFGNVNGNNGYASGSTGFASSAPTAKRGSKACVACRKGKNRCEFDPSNSNGTCRRCLMNGTACVFEKAGERGRGRNESVSGGEGLSGESEGRVASLERSVHDLAQGQNQIQNALQQILSMLPQTSSLSTTPQSFLSNHMDQGIAPNNIFQNSVSPPSIFQHSPQTATAHSHAHMGMMLPPPTATLLMSPQNTASGRASINGMSGNQDAVKGRGKDGKEFPKLPGFAPPNHQFGTYGIIPLPSAPPSPSHRARNRSRSSSVSSTASSTALPHESLTAPIQALQTLAHAADQAASMPGDQDKREDLDEVLGGKKRKRVTIDGVVRGIELRVKKKKKPDPTPRNPFPSVVEKGLVTDQEARELWDIFFQGCHYFVPLWDKTYDTYETYIDRTPFSTNGLLAVAAKIRAGNGPLGQTFHRSLEEAQGIARSTLFGPIVRKEAVMAMLILSVWSQNGWLPCGHALRMGLDMNLHRALDKLADGTGHRGEVEERDLVVSARIWLNCYMHDNLASLGTGKPLLLRDNGSVRKARILLSHAMASETDIRLIAGVELVNLRIGVFDHLSPLHGKVDASTIAFVKRAFSDLAAWHKEWHTIHRAKYDEEAVLVKLLEAELVHAQLWTVCVALRGCQWDKLPVDQRELAFQAKDAAMRCLEIFLRSINFRSHLKYATHDQLVSVAFAAVFLLKIAILYPTAISLPTLISQVSELAHLLSTECFAERYALTLRLMLSNFRRKTGVLSTVPGTPRMTAYNTNGLDMTQLPNNPHSQNGGLAMGELDGGLQSLLTLPMMGGSGSGQGATGGGGAGGMEGLWDEGMGGFDWPTEFSPSNLPVWLQDGNFTDLGLPADGSDSLFLPLELANMFLPPSGNYQFTLPDSADVGAEAW